MKKTLLLSLTLLFSLSAFAADYTIDPDHSSVGFKIKHLGISTVKGEFLKFEGTIKYDPANLKASSVKATVDTKSIDTQVKKRDDHLRGTDFFDTEKFPSISFESKEIKNIQGDSFDVLGELTMRGVTKPITLQVTSGGVAKDAYGNERAAFSATTSLNRKDFGLSWSKVLETGGLVVGDDVKIELEVEAIKAKPS